MKTIIHTCSSILIRPNGIVRYINDLIDLQRAQGHYVVFVTDSKPSQVINANQVSYATTASCYRPNMKDGHVWLQFDSFVADQIQQSMQRYADSDLVIAHDLHSYEAASRDYSDGIFIQHESDIMTAGSRFSYMDDEYLARQFAVVDNTNWRIGMTVGSTNILPKRPVYTPSPMVLDNFYDGPKSKGLLYIGDTSDRKGAKEFMQMARDLNVRPTVITHEVDAELFKDADVYTFNLSDRNRMYSLIKQHKVAYLPSKNECPGLAVLECLQYIPVVVDGQYEWTKYVSELGAIVETGDGIKSALEFHLANEEMYNRNPLETYSKYTHQLWTNLTQ